jgi:hypothetical protein
MISPVEYTAQFRFTVIATKKNFRCGEFVELIKLGK